MAVDLLPGDGKADAEIQIGPVLRGTSLRDAMGFIEFGQFVNQLEFANVGNELNARVSRQVLPRARALAVTGNNIEFAGTFSESSGSLPQIVPVTIQAAKDAK
jgi:predicted lipoprotein